MASMAQTPPSWRRKGHSDIDQSRPIRQATAKASCCGIQPQIRATVASSVRSPRRFVLVYKKQIGSRMSQFVRVTSGIIGRRQLTLISQKTAPPPLRCIPWFVRTLRNWSYVSTTQQKNATATEAHASGYDLRDRMRNEASKHVAAASIKPSTSNCSPPISKTEFGT